MSDAVVGRLLTGRLEARYADGPESRRAATTVTYRGRRHAPFRFDALRSGMTFAICPQGILRPLHLTDFQAEDVLIVINELLRNSQVADVVVFTTGNVRRAVRAIEAAVPEDASATLLVGRVWDRVPARDRLVWEIGSLLAEAALARWPDWYDDTTSQLGTAPKSSAPCDDGEAVIRRAKLKRNALPGWVKRAVRRCEVGRSPLLKRFSVEVQLRQLALAMSAQRFVLALALDVKQLSEGDAKCFADVCLWAVQLGAMRIAVVIDQELVACPGLQAICCQVHSLDATRETREGPEGPRQAPRVQRDTSRPSPVNNDAEEPGGEAPRARRRDGKHRDLFAWPVIGVPHPFSPAERRLARRLGSDPDLQGRFQFNWPIESSAGNRYVVDLFCESARLVVEVDGYRTHSGLANFQSDRDRDFMLAIDGYTVARLTHNEIMHDIEASMSEIRTLLLARLNVQ